MKYISTEKLIAKIKDEIERRKGICEVQIKVNPGQTFPFIMEMTGYDKILSFLDTIPVEEQVDLDNEIDEQWDKFVSSEGEREDFNTICHYLYELGKNAK